jgi:lysophospholipase L1-like esterase
VARAPHATSVAAVARPSAPLIAALGDSINAGSPIWDPDPGVRARIGARLDERSQWEYWYARSHPDMALRNCGVFGERTDQIAARLDVCSKGARYLVIQGGINDIAQGASIDEAADNIDSMIERGKQLGLRVGVVEVLPWNNGYPSAAPLISRLNTKIRAVARARHVPVSRWYSALEDPANPGRMKPALTIDGDHPSVAGYRLLASKLRLP